MIRCLHEGKKVLLSTNLPNHFTKRDYSTPRDSLLRIFLRVNFFFLFPSRPLVEGSYVDITKTIYRVTFVA